MGIIIIPLKIRAISALNNNTGLNHNNNVNHVIRVVKLALAIKVINVNPAIVIINIIKINANISRIGL